MFTQGSTVLEAILYGAAEGLSIALVATILILVASGILSPRRHRD